MAGDEWHGSLFYVIGNYSVMFLSHKKALRAGFFLNFKFQYPEKFIMKKTANKCSKNSSIFEMGMLLYIKRKRIHVRKICSDIIDQRIRAIFICLT